MNYIEQIFDRCNIETLCEFLMHGSELVETNNSGYYNRVRNAEKRLSEWLNREFSDCEESEECFSPIYSVFSEIKSVYMQIGLQAGIMLAAKFRDKKNKTQ